MTPAQTIGKYEIIQELGRGGFAIVYQARDPELDRVVALKVLHPYWGNDPSVVSRFQREARLAARLRHPHIVTIYEVGQASGQPYLAMTYLPGHSLRTWLEAIGPLPLVRALPILAQLASALDYAHAQGVIHRDVKPANIIIEENGADVQATLTDFGLVKALAGDTGLTSQGTIIGTPRYMAPEQADPNRVAEIGPATDRYALGIVAYELLTGRVPFPGNTPATLHAQVYDPPPPPRDLRPDLPEAVETVLLKMLAKNPADRYSSGGEFIEELAQAAREIPKPVPIQKESPNSDLGSKDGCPSIFKSRIAGVSISIIIICAVVWWILTGPAITPAITVDSHQEGDWVEQTEEISGTYRNLGSDWRLWGLVQSESDNYWVDDSFPLDKNQGEWQLTAYFGYRDTRSLGEKFKFLVLAVKKDSDAEKYLQSLGPDSFKELPTDQDQVIVFDSAISLIRGAPTNRWLADFWANTTWKGEPMVTQEITTTYLFQEWWNPPVDDSTGGWTARFVRRIHFPQESEYCFYWKYKNEVTISVDEQELQPAQKTEDWGEVESVCRQLVAGNHEIRIDYANPAEVEGALEFWYPPPETSLATELLPGQWQVAFFPTPTLQGSPLWTTTLPGPFLDFGMTAPEIPVINFGAIMTYTLTLTEAGYYHFDLAVDDGVRFFIDEAKVLDEWHGGPGTYAIEKNLESGNHTFRLEYYEYGWEQYVKLNWRIVTPPIPPVQRVLFASDRDGDYDIYVMDINGANPINLTNNTAKDFDPAWSPDGRQIIFGSDREDGWAIYKMNLDGSNLIRLPAGFQPRWSPDSSRIVFMAGPEWKWEIYVMDADGTNITQLTNNDVADFTPSWSPDGSRIVFETGREGEGNEEVYVMNADGSNPVNLSQNPAWDGAPAWSPDGRSIAFQSNRDGNDEIYVMNADGSSQRRLTNQETSDRFPTWSPDSQRLIFEKHNQDNTTALLYLIDAAGKMSPLQLTGPNGKHERAQWSPPGYGYTFQSFTDGDDIEANAITVAGDYVWTGGKGGLMRWNRDDPDQQQKYTSENGLAENNVRAIVADSDTTLWFGTGGWPFSGSGLSRYDFTEGHQHWRTFTASDGLGDNTIFNLYRDKQERLWAGTRAGARVYDGQNWQGFEELKDSWVTSICETSTGIFWFAVSDVGVVRYDPSSSNDTAWQRFNLMELLHSNNDGYKHSSAIIEGAPGELWIATNAGVVYYNGEKWQAAGSELDVWASAVVREVNGTFWFGTHKGLVRLDTAGQRVYTTADGLTDDNIQALFLDDANILWAAGNGLNRYDQVNDRWQSYRAHDDQAHNQVSAILQDSTGAFWFGHTLFYNQYIWSSGVSRYRPGSPDEWQEFDTKDGLSANAVHVIYQENDGTIWFGFDRSGGGVCRYNVQQDRILPCYKADPNGLITDTVDSIVQTRDGALWFGTSGGGLSRFDHQRWQTFTQTNSGLLSDQVHCLAEDDEGALWITTDQGVNRFLYERGEWIPFTSHNSDLIADEVSAIAPDGKNGIWFGTTKGLSRYDLTTKNWRNIEGPPALANWVDNCTQALHVDRYGTLWVGTDQGLYRSTQGGGWLRLTTANGLVSNHVLAIFEDNEGTFWVGTPSGVSQLHLTTATTTLTLGSIRVRESDGMVMVYAPAGTFMMGSAADDSAPADDEKPQHPVTLDAFWLDQTEITNAQFRKFIEATNYTTTAEKTGLGYVYTEEKWEEVTGANWQHPNGPDSQAKDTHPVVQVSWADASTYCAWAGGRLPTEAEWEYAARGPENHLYPWGNEFDATRFNSCDKNCSFSWKAEFIDDGYARTAPVGSYPAGASWVSAQDMAGNVWEWIGDWYGPYPAEGQTNPTGPASGDHRVLHGGSWDIGEDGVRAADRIYFHPDSHIDNVGFRCVVSPGQGIGE